MAQIDSLLVHIKSNDGSDLHLVAGQPPRFRTKGKIRIIEGEPEISQEELLRLMQGIASTRAWEEYQATGDLDFAFGLEGVARFRANYFVQDSGAAAVFRIIPEEMRTSKKVSCW
jgi:twitching motility protein PilT